MYARFASVMEACVKLNKYKSEIFVNLTNN